MGHIASQCPKKEAAVNGPQFATGHVLSSVGWAEKPSGSGTNFTACLNGVVVPEHLFKKEDESVTLYHTAYPNGVKCLKSAAKKIGNDTLYFARPAGWAVDKVRDLRTADGSVGSKVELLTYADKASAIAGFEKHHHDSSVVKSIMSNPGEEKAWYRSSTRAGSCGSPVVNTDGKVIGFHNATTAVDTVFIPLTAVMRTLACGSNF
jgi:hypothetical protein